LFEYIARRTAVKGFFSSTWFQLRNDALRHDLGDVPYRGLDPGDGLDGVIVLAEIFAAPKLEISSSIRPLNGRQP
jgi:hypothetical protein